MLLAAVNPNGNLWRIQQCLHQLRHRSARLTANLYVHRKFKSVKHIHPLPDGEAPRREKYTREFEESMAMLFKAKSICGTWKRNPKRLRGENECARVIIREQMYANFHQNS